MPSVYTTFPLLAIAAVVCIGLLRKRNMWGWIVLYWAVLCTKNLLDLLGVLS